MAEHKKNLTHWSRWTWTGLAIVYAGIFCTILLFAYQGKLPGILTQNDKLAHVILYAIATFVGHRAFNRRRIKVASRLLPLFPCLFMLFTIIEELVQSFSPNRTLDGWDLIASVVGIGLGYGLAALGRSR
jgi:VanZ family protein